MKEMKKKSLGKSHDTVNANQLEILRWTVAINISFKQEQQRTVIKQEENMF